MIEIGKRNKKVCSKIGCNNLVSHPNKYCDEHKTIEKENSYHRYKEYDRGRQGDRVTQFYKSREWRNFREMILSRDNYLCQNCLKERRLVIGNIVHHKIEVRDGEEGWKNKLNADNVETICPSCHSSLHKSKGSWGHFDKKINI